jgi:5-methylcytosine-specific restriction endonuclease McrA
MGGDRAGKAFTPKGKQEVKDHNKLSNGGRMKCENPPCGKQVKNSKQSKKGVSTPKDEARVDHIYPKSKGGDGSPENGQVLCSGCNLGKSDKLE